MNTNRKTTTNESKVKPTASRMIRWAGLAAMASGILFVAIQAIHPLDLLESVTTSQWALAHYVGIAMTFLGLIGLTGIYARQVEESGWLGLAGYLLFSLFYAISLAFQFLEAFVSPVLATEAPRFVEAILGVASGHATGFNLGALPGVYQMTGFVGYLLGGVLLGVATLRAGILPRWAGALLAFATLLPVVTSSLLPHPLDRILAVPMGVALAWLGYALFTERRAKAAQSLAGSASPRVVQSVAK